MRKTLILIAAICCTIQLTSARVLTGIEVLREGGFSELQGKRIGLVTNPTGVDAELRSTIDILSKAPGVTLAALFAPEHGVRGDIAAGAAVSDTKDRATGVTVHSLYGSSRKPKAETLKGLDAIVFDIQDIGSRSYTFISTMGLVMEAAAENGIEVVILDRPNPLGGLRIEGCEARAPFISFVSQFPIPYIHGMSVGELAQLLNTEGRLRGAVRCKLTVVPMRGWKRSMSWEQTGLPWVPTSPHIPQSRSALFYPITGTIGEIGGINIGVGYTMPFECMATEWITNADLLASRLNSLGLSGIRFRPTHYKALYGSASGKQLHGVQIYLDQPTTPTSTPITLIPFYVLQELAKLYPDKRPIEASTNHAMFDKVMGTDAIRKSFVAGGYQVSSIEKLWQPSPDFIAARQKALLYQ